MPPIPLASPKRHRLLYKEPIILNRELRVKNVDNEEGEDMAVPTCDGLSYSPRKAASNAAPLGLPRPVQASHPFVAE